MQPGIISKQTQQTICSSIVNSSQDFQIHKYKPLIRKPNGHKNYRDKNNNTQNDIQFRYLSPKSISVINSKSNLEQLISPPRKNNMPAFLHQKKQYSVLQQNIKPFLNTNKQAHLLKKQSHNINNNQIKQLKRQCKKHKMNYENLEIEYQKLQKSYLKNQQKIKVLEQKLSCSKNYEEKLSLANKHIKKLQSKLKQSEKQIQILNSHLQNTQHAQQKLTIFQKQNYELKNQFNKAAEQIKYMEIQLNVFKRKKFDITNLELKYEKLNQINKYLQSKLSQFKQKRIKSESCITGKKKDEALFILTPEASPKNSVKNNSEEKITSFKSIN